MPTATLTPPTRVFAALADPTRCQVVQRLARQPASAGELASLTGLTASSMSRHLKVLLDAELVVDQRGERDARVRMFRLRPDTVAASAVWIAAVQDHWDANLASYARTVADLTEGTTP